MLTDLPEVIKFELMRGENIDIYEELTDPRFAHRLHHSRKTYTDGCHGPLCTKAERDQGRKRSEERAKAAGRTYSPRESAAQRRDGLLELIASWHRHHPDQVMVRAEARTG